MKNKKCKMTIIQVNLLWVTLQIKMFSILLEFV